MVGQSVSTGLIRLKKKKNVIVKMEGYYSIVSEQIFY